MSSNLSHLLRNSRIAHVPKSKKPLNSASPRFHPTHQIIETKPSTLHRQEWGLKSSIPSKVQTRYIIFNDLDTLERLTTFEPNAGSQWSRLRFQELGVAPSYNAGKSNPLFEGSSSSSSQLVPLSSLLNIDPTSSRADVEKKLSQVKSLRNVFKKWLLSNNPEALKNKSFSAKDMSDNAVEFLSESIGTNTGLNSASLNKVIGTGGLSYNIGGRLRQSPNGVVSKTVVPGRFLNVEGNDRLAAIGGFVANAGSSSPNTSQIDYNMGDFIRELKFPFAVNRAFVQDNGKVVLRANVISGMSSKARMQMSGKNYQQRPSRTTSPAVNPEDSTKYAEELLNILTNFDSGNGKKLR